jgi:hypothetical protein
MCDDPTAALLDYLCEQFGRLHVRLDRIELGLAEIKAPITSLERRLPLLRGDFDRQSGGVHSIEVRLDRIECRLDRLAPIGP